MLHKPYLIGVTGGSGSGKTSFLKKLRENFSENELCIICQDDYYKSRSLQMKDENGIRNFDLPESIEFEQLAEDVKKLINHNSITRQEYTFNNEKQDAKILTIFPAPVIIIEGLFTFYFEKHFDFHYNLRVFINAKDNLRVIRRIKRDRIERNYPIEDVLYRYERHVMPAYELFIEPYVKRSDIIINNNVDFNSALLVFNGFLKEYIRENSKYFQ